MAKIMHGSLAGAVSGSLGNCTFSHNRYGAYIRTRGIPTLVRNEFTLGARAKLIDASQSFGALTDAQQKAWRLWADSNPITDRLGQKQVLTPHAAFVRLNGRILVGGGTKINVPPAVAAPAALTTMTTTFDIGTGTSTVVFAPSPLGASNCLYVQAAVLSNPGQRYYANKLKLVKVSAVNLATPYDYQADVEARFGPLVVGQRLIILCSVLDNATGLMSAPYVDEGVITEAA